MISSSKRIGGVFRFCILPLQPVIGLLDVSASRGFAAKAEGSRVYTAAEKARWIHETLEIVRGSNASEMNPLVKEQLWEECQNAEKYSIPSKSNLSESLNWLRKHKLVSVAKSDQGTRKHPKFGFFPLSQDPYKLSKHPTEVVDQWTQRCLKETDGQKRAVVMGNDASVLAYLALRYEAEQAGQVATTREQTAIWRRVEMQDELAARKRQRRKVDGTHAMTEKEQVHLRITKAIEHQSDVLHVNRRDRDHAAHSRAFMEKMRDAASQGLKGIHKKKFDAQVQLHAGHIGQRLKRKEAEIRRREVILGQYEKWLEVLNTSSLLHLEQELKKEKLTLGSIFPEVSHNVPGGTLDAEKAAAKSMAENQAALGVEERVWQASQSELRTDMMKRKAESSEQHAYADRMAEMVQKDGQEAVAEAEDRLAETRDRPWASFIKRAKEMSRKDGWAWQQHSLAVGEMVTRAEKVRKQERSKRFKMKDDSRKSNLREKRNDRVGGAAAKRAGGADVIHQRQLQEAARRRWSHQGHQYVARRSLQQGSWLGWDAKRSKVKNR